MQTAEVKKRRKHAPEETRAQLLRASAKCFAAVGYGRTQVSDVTREAGVAVGTFYVHFTDKEEALLTVLRNHFEPVRNGLDLLRSQLKDARPRDLARSLRLIQKFIIDHSLQDADGFLAWYRHGHDVSENADRLVLAYYVYLETVISEELKAAAIDDKSSLLLARANVGLLLSLIHRRLLTGEPGEDDALRASLLLSMGGIAAVRAEQSGGTGELEKLLGSVRDLAA
jgi:AcrR family transcriptional regulator